MRLEDLPIDRPLVLSAVPLRQLKIASGSVSNWRPARAYWVKYPSLLRVHRGDLVELYRSQAGGFSRVPASQHAEIIAAILDRRDAAALAAAPSAPPATNNEPPVTPPAPKPKPAAKKTPKAAKKKPTKASG